MPNSGKRAERPVPVREGDRGHDLPVPEAERRPALRHGLRRVRQAALRPARVARPLLRPAARRQRAGARRQHVRVQPADVAVLAAAEPGRASRTQSPAQLTAYQYNSKLPTSTEWSAGVADADSLGDVGGRGVRGPSQLQRRADRAASTPSTSARRSIPAKQDPTSAPSATPGASSLAALFPDLVRGYKGYTAIAYAELRRLARRTTRSSSRSTGASGTASRSASTTRSRCRTSPRSRRATTTTPPASRCSAPTRARRRTCSRISSSRRHLMKATALWQLPDHARATSGAGAGAGLDRQRLAAVGRLDGRDGHAVRRRVQLPERRRQREPDRLAGLRRAHPDRRRSRRRVQQQPVRAVQRRGVPGPAGRQHGAGIVQQLSEGCFASALDLSLAARHPAGRRPATPAPRRRVQRAEPGAASPAGPRR